MTLVLMPWPTVTCSIFLSRFFETICHCLEADSVAQPGHSRITHCRSGREDSPTISGATGGRNQSSVVAVTTHVLRVDLTYRALLLGTSASTILLAFHIVHTE